ncbi:hypothetical protein SNEBB_006935 [Seison nebaliae]|nr:hypothetical protein SNEBB_006935 [Seison nebaliae]
MNRFVDRFNRIHNYLRISLTEKCNLRCGYCMPETGVQLSAKKDLLSFDELKRIITIFVDNNVRKIRLTGGEPTIYKQLPELMDYLNFLKRKQLLDHVAMTTNGIALKNKSSKIFQSLVNSGNSGIDSLNFSLDTFDPKKYGKITRMNLLSRVLQSLSLCVDAVEEGKIKYLKLNVVLIKQFNEDELFKFIELTRENLIEVRFIEFMPFEGNQWNSDKFISQNELCSRISAQYNLRKIPNEINGTANRYQIENFRGTIGFIASMSQKFCSSCNRLRLTANGKIKNCLFDNHELDLKDLIRNNNITNEDIGKFIQLNLQNKKKSHAVRNGYLKNNEKPTDGVNRRLISTKQQMRSIHIHSIRFGEFTHISKGSVEMVDVSNKTKGNLLRQATVVGELRIEKKEFENLSKYFDERTLKTLETTINIAGVLGGKQTAKLIPLCHQINLSQIKFSMNLIDNCFILKCHVRTGQDSVTGVEMEALTGCSIALLTLYDMLKSVVSSQKYLEIRKIKVIQKIGGRNDMK